ncbi:MAG: type II toxin-antitoxin system CcdA family antitoxin [Candidatus Bathyarchaeota archaeon]|nr:type II toxin-antitoxin system CcdA family antitoxin [Candidatus Bathyarchaeota archaeon]
MKAKVTINIDKEVYQKAHELGINVSKACENYLKQLIEAIEGINRQNNPNETNENKVKPRAGFGPATITLPR